ncbi:zinc metallopeptidase [Pullulanibacillus sp. KACC 23026]|uniref:zinc metallopeptidase n=1 Tax=Pullulanibacillus sp. KACC 23026 TaxID=3028315 RepID=UPI0023AFC604|nr:zinc metallopeptidase [Pullulanibacillus sp. KACC 23026]WEG14977.1 zinc metallopeptidase [Pullulanibacillus sp. KACC 23026]
MGYLIYFVLIMIIPFWAQMRVKGTFSKYARVRNNRGITGYEAARRILDANGLYHIDIELIPGELTDHYDPRGKVLRLSEQSYYGASVAGVAVAAHEVGHAIQDKKNYAPLRMRHALVPVANIGSSLSWIFILAGVFLHLMQAALIGVILFGAAVLFQIVTLPVEFNASRRAMVQLQQLGLIDQSEKRRARSVLSAAALTYVAAALVAVLELLRFVLMLVGMNNRDNN